MATVLDGRDGAAAGTRGTAAAVAHSAERSSAAAGTEIGEQIRGQLGGERADAVILFASARHDYEALLHGVDAACAPWVLVGCSSAGEFTSGAQAEGSVSAVGLRAPGMALRAGIGRGLRSDVSKAARELVASFRGIADDAYAYRSALVLTDALAGHADALVQELNVLTAGRFTFFGGGAGDDGRFERTHVFHGTDAVTDAVVALEILSNKPVGVGVRHGWSPVSEPMRVTEAEGMALVSLDNTRAVEVFEEHAESTGQRFEREAPLPFFLHNVLGLEAAGEYRLRVPLGVGLDGAVACAAETPVGTTACIMGATAASAVEAAAQATESALAQLEGHEPAVALFFDCVATRLRMGRAFGGELEAVQRALGDARFVGFNTYGQIARAAGQFSGFHNCTAVVCVLPA